MRLGRLPTIEYRDFDKERPQTDGPRPGDERREFEIDRSRIVHSASFRRLQGKTQVFADGEGERFIRAANRRERTGARGTVVSDRYLYEVIVLPTEKLAVSLINSIVWRAVMRSPQVMTLEAKACQLLRQLFERFTQDDGYYLLPDDWRELSSPSQDRAGRARIVADYISGMTDDYAGKLYSRLFLPNHGTVFDLM